MRLEGKAQAGQFYCPPAVVDMIASYLESTHAGVRMADPFGGDGRTLDRLATHLGIPASHRYLCELQSADAEIATQVAAHVVCADTFTELSVSPELVGLLLSNPPFDFAGWMGREDERARTTAASDRDELRALRRLILPSNLNLLQAGGVHVVIAPQHVMAHDLASILARWHDDWMVAAFPEAHRKFGEAVFLGIKRAKPLADAALEGAVAVLTACLGDLFELDVTATPRYAVPAPLRMKQPRWRNRAVSVARETQAAIVRDGGVWTSDSYQRRRAQLGVTAYSPVSALNSDQAAVWIAAGKVNGQRVTLDGREVVIKGTTGINALVSEDIAIKDGKQETKTVRMTVTTPQLATFDPERGAFTVYDGGPAIGELISRNGNGDALVAAVAHAAPPRYDAAHPNPTWWNLLTSIRSHSGRKLPGAAEPGLNDRQKHAVSAAMEALLHPDPRTGYQLPGVILGWEPRCGKTPSTVTMVEALRRLGMRHPRGKGRAFTALVAAPTLVVGDRKQVVEFFQGKRPKLPEWYATWMDILPDWHIEILESPAQVSAFFRHAQAHPDQPHVGMLTLEIMRNDSGWENSARDQTSARDANLQRHSHAASELLAWEAMQVRSAEAEDGASEDEDTTPTPPRSRIERRDALVHPSYRPSRYGAVVCPDCGRVQRQLAGDAQGQPLLRSAIKGIDDGRCQWCGTAYAHQARQVNNTRDAKLPIYRSTAWRNDYAEDPRPMCRRDGTPVTTRAIPWGTRPTSNPRMALGPFIRARYTGAIDVLVVDECHKAKGRDTAVGRAMAALIHASHRTVALTGTVFSGYAESVFALLWHLGNPILRQSYGWDDCRLFVRQYGLHKVVTVERRAESSAGVYNGKTSTRQEIVELPGITSALAEMVLAQTVNVQLVEMGFWLTPYTERAVYLDLDMDVEEGYTEAKEQFMAALRDSPRCAGSGLQMLLQYPLRAHDPKPMVWYPSKEAAMNGEDPSAWWPRVCASALRPHETWLAEYILAERAKDRRVLLYVDTTGDDDLMPHLEQQLKAAAVEQGVTLNVARLYSDKDSRGRTVRSGVRDAWFAEQAAAGIDVIICNPRLVDVGISLLDWPSIVFVQTPYSLFIVDQAKKRPWGPMQAKPVEVVFLAYAQTMGAVALNLVAQKSGALATLKGAMLNAGIAQFDAGMSLFAAMAKAVQDGTTEASDANALFAEVSATLNASFGVALPAVHAEPVGATADAPAAPASPTILTVPIRSPRAAKKPTMTLTVQAAPEQLMMTFDFD